MEAVVDMGQVLRLGMGMRPVPWMLSKSAPPASGSDCLPLDVGPGGGRGASQGGGRAKDRRQRGARRRLWVPPNKLQPR